VNTVKSSFNKTADEEEPRSYTGLLYVISFLILFISFVLSFIAFFSPFWYVELNTGYMTGLWGRCATPEIYCIWFIERDSAWEKSIPQWHVAAQVLYAIGIIVLFLCMMTSVGQLMFRCCKMSYRLPLYIGVFILVAVLFELLSIMVFGIGAYRDFEVSINSWVGHFEWAFFVGIAALFVVSAAGVIYIHVGRVWHAEMHGYELSLFI